VRYTMSVYESSKSVCVAWWHDGMTADAQLDRDGLTRNLPEIYWASYVEG